MLVYEAGGPAVHSGLVMRGLPGVGRPDHARAAARRRGRSRRLLQPASVVVLGEHAPQRRRARLAARRARGGRRDRARARARRPPRRRADHERRRGERDGRPPSTAGLPTPSRSASRRGSAARSAPCSPARRERIERGLARQVPVRRRDAPGGDRRRGGALRARPPRRPARRGSRARAAPRRGPGGGRPARRPGRRSRRTSSASSRPRSGSTSPRRIARIAEHGRPRRSCLRPGVLRARDLPRRDRRRRRPRDRGDPARAGSPCPCLRHWRPSSRLAREAQADERLPSVAAAVFRARRGASGEAVGLADAERGEQATPDTSTASARSRRPSRPRRSCSCATPASSTSTTGSSAHVPEAADGRRRCGALLAHLSGLQREPPGEIWETMEPPDREGCSTRSRRAEQVHRAGPALALLEPRLRAARRGGRPAARHAVRSATSRSGCSRRSGSSGTTWEQAAPFARGYLVEPYEDVLRAEPPSTSRPSAPPASSGARSATSPAGARSSPSPTRRAAARVRGGDARLPGHVRARSAGRADTASGSSSSGTATASSSGTPAGCPATSRASSARPASAPARSS